MKKIALSLLIALLAMPAWATGTGTYNNFDCWNGGINMLPSTATGNANVACGAGALQKMNGANFDTAVGSRAAEALTTGNANTAMGYQALKTTTTGSGNTVIGYLCDTPAAGTSNFVALCGNTTAVQAFTANAVTNGVSKILGDSRVSTQFDAAATTTLANITGLTATLEASKNYYFTARLYFSADATGGHKYAIAGTSTATAIRYQVTSVCNAGTGAGTSVITAQQTALAGSSGQAGCTAGYTEINGTMTVNAAGTLTVQFAQNAASGTSSVLVGSIFTVREVP